MKNETKCSTARAFDVAWSKVEKEMSYAFDRINSEFHGVSFLLQAKCYIFEVSRYLFYYEDRSYVYTKYRGIVKCSRCGPGY